MELINETRRTFTATERYKFDAYGKINAGDFTGQQQLMAVDLLFRLYLPLYSLLKQTGKHEEL
jgi:hypothetical protein